jgi:hypothetical protein
MTATRQRTRIATTLVATLGVGVLGLAGAASAGAATPDGNSTPQGCEQACTVSVPPSLDAGLWTAKDGAPRYRIDGIGFSEGKVKVVVTTKGGKTLWTRTVETGYDEGLPEPTFHVGTKVRCDHRTRYVTAQDLSTGEWTEAYTLNPCIL